MKSFKQFSHAYGTYACIKPDAASVDKLNSLCRENNIVPDHDFHCTIVYSKVPCPAVTTIIPHFPITTTSNEFDIFGQEKRCLVLRLESEDIHNLFKQAMMLGASYDYPKYEPHVTLSYDFQGTELPKISNLKLTFETYHVEALEEK